MEQHALQRLSGKFPELELLLKHANLPSPQFAVSEVRCQTVRISMRDRVKLATDVYLPPLLSAPVIVMRTPYNRSQDLNGYVGMLLAFARRGYVVVSQDCRGTGQSEPQNWDYYVFESED